MSENSPSIDDLAGWPLDLNEILFREMYNCIISENQTQLHHPQWNRYIFRWPFDPSIVRVTSQILFLEISLLRDYSNQLTNISPEEEGKLDAYISGYFAIAVSVMLADEELKRSSRKDLVRDVFKGNYPVLFDIKENNTHTRGEIIKLANILKEGGYSGLIDYLRISNLPPSVEQLMDNKDALKEVTRNSKYSFDDAFFLGWSYACNRFPKIMQTIKSSKVTLLEGY